MHQRVSQPRCRQSPRASLQYPVHGPCVAALAAPGFHQADSQRASPFACRLCQTLANENSPSRELVAYLEVLRPIWSHSMGNVKSIEKAVQSLPPSELAEFRRWFAEFDADAWDKQIEQDAAAGRLDAMAAEALADCRAGSVREL